MRPLRLTPTGFRLQFEPFNQPFGFKGSSFHEKWNAVVRLVDEEQNSGYGLGGLAVLWSDARVFSEHTETGGNVLMLALLERALQCVRGRDFRDPIVMQNEIFQEVYAYGKRVTENESLSPTFVLNALVALDNAAWVLYARGNRVARFDDLIPPAVRPALNERQTRLALVPLITYDQSDAQVRSVLDDGAGLIKVKIGQSGSESDMLTKDMERLSEVHRIASVYETPMTQSGRVLYYLDANGRYQSRESILRLLDHAERIGALGRIALLEEPFDEGRNVDVGDLPVRVAADESLHSVEDVRRRCEQGYRAIAIKPAGKTLSMAFQMAQAADTMQVPCYVADNACVPVLVDWNKCFASRLSAFPGMTCGILESNGPQMYDAWNHLLDAHHCSGAPWLKPTAGQFRLDESFYQSDGGIFLDPLPYAQLFDTT